MDAPPKAVAPSAAVTAVVPGGAPVPPKRSPGHRGADVKDTVAEMAAKAHEISLEAGSKMAAAMKDVVNGAAGITGFVVESARDLVQFMVRRGQMTQEEADKLMREAEEHQAQRKPRSPAPKASLSNAGGSRSAASKSRTSSAAHKPAAKKDTHRPASKSKAKPAPKTKAKPAPKTKAKAKAKPMPKPKSAAKPASKAGKSKKR